MFIQKLTTLFLFISFESFCMYSEYPITTKKVLTYTISKLAEQSNEFNKIIINHLLELFPNFSGSLLNRDFYEKIDNELKFENGTTYYEREKNKEKYVIAIYKRLFSY
jgi:hypothetical protein